MLYALHGQCRLFLGHLEERLLHLYLAAIRRRPAASGTACVRRSCCWLSGDDLRQHVHGLRILLGGLGVCLVFGRRCRSATRYHDGLYGSRRRVGFRLHGYHVGLPRLRLARRSLNAHRLVDSLRVGNERIGIGIHTLALQHGVDLVRDHVVHLRIDVIHHLSPRFCPGVLLLYLMLPFQRLALV